MEQVNIGLGEAIAEGTNASGNFGNPITQGIGIGQRNILLEAQKEEKKRAKQLAMQEKMAKYSNFDPSKWYDKGIGSKAHEAIKTKLPLIYEKVTSGDDIGRIQLEQELSNEIAMYKIQDGDVKKIGTAKRDYATTAPAQKRYAKEGIKGILNDATNYPPSMAIADIDTETGNFELRNIPKVNLTRDLGKLSESIIPTKKGQVVGTQQYYNVDLKSPEYQNARAAAVNSYLSSNEKAMGILVSDEFKEFFDKQLEANNIPRESVLDNDDFAEDVLAAYVGMKFDETASKKVKPQTIRKASSGGASGESKFTFTPEGSGYIVNYKGKGGIIEKIDGNVIENGVERKVTLDVNDPTLLYNPRNKTFTIKGKRKHPVLQGQYKDVELTNVSPASVMSKFELKESDLISKFGAQGYGKAAAKTTQPKGKKLSFPKWKAQNPNGTNEQFKQYLKS
jgi:hypothetical protein